MDGPLMQPYDNYQVSSNLSNLFFFSPCTLCMQNQVKQLPLSNTLKSIIYPVGPVYYFPGHLSNTISSGDLKFYVGFKKVKSEHLENCDFVDPQYHSWRSPYQTQNNLDYIKIEIFKVNPQIDSNIVVPTVCELLKQNLSQIIRQRFGHVSITRLKLTKRKGLI